MAYFAVYDTESGEIQNIIECPEFLSRTIHRDENQQVLELEKQVSALKYKIKDHQLIEIL
ncbi:hypothetical protein ABW55_09545 [Acinetobacter sp. C15]|uniref:hypothetical protein n=1 Tax=Acinetobacter TaxID=469 RepID=UPI0006ABD0B3|nr:MULTISPECIES: hypothetical protein [Acinetobacter]KOR15260.1 hypothetical protein ABW55_09545 [Acinetobacter sp. C15]